VPDLALVVALTDGLPALAAVGVAAAFLLMGAAGAVVRWWVSTRQHRRWFRGLPMPTLAVNVVGSFMLGCLAGSGLDKQVLTVAGTGFVGSFTTFSTFVRENHALVTAGHRRRAMAYTGLSLAVGLAAAAAGYALLTYR
jgi:fluoride exporter